MVNSALLRSSFLVLFQIVLLKCEKLPDLNEVNSRIREETARYYGNQPAHKTLFKNEPKSLAKLQAERAPVSSAINITVMDHKESLDGGNMNEIDVPSRLPSIGFRETSKFGDRNNVEGGDDASARIWYGDDATEGEFPFMARLSVNKKYYSSGSRSSYGMCGGSIISKRLILTAAHCVVISRENWHELEDPSRYEIKVGDHSSSTNRNERTYKAEGVIVHPGYDNGNTLANDIAMVVLAEDIDFGNGVGVIKVPESGDAELMNEGKTVTVAGWGSIEGGASANVLRKMESEFSNRVLCKRYWYYRRMDITDGMACTDRVPLEGGDKYAHIWSGDSGSALFKKNTDGSFTQLALVSWSTSVEQIAAPDIHTNVFYYRDWIREHMGMMDSTYLQRSRAYYDAYRDLEFKDMRHYLYRRANLYTTSSYLRVQVDVTLNNIPNNHFVLVYDGADIEKDKMIAMLTRDEELTGIVSSSYEGLTVVMQTNDRGDLFGSVDIRYSAILPPSDEVSTSLRCPNGFWACVDERYCIREDDVCDNVQGSEGQCRDASDEDEGCKEEEEEEDDTPDDKGWIGVVPGSTSFTWDYKEGSLAVQAAGFKGSWYSVYVELSHETAGEPMWFEMRFGAVEVYIRVHNCTEYFVGMNYPSSYTSRQNTEYMITFNDDYMSVVGNQEVLWNLEYEGGITMDSCLDAVKGISSRGKFAAEDTATDKFKIMPQPTNDKLDKEPDSTYIKDYSQYDEVSFSAMVRDTAIHYDVLQTSLQIITRGEIAIKTGIVLDIYTKSSDQAYSYIEIYFFESAPYYYLDGCTENVILFPLPDADTNGDRVWTFDFDTANRVIFRCNGKEFGRVVAGSSAVKTGCSSVLGNGKVDRIKFPSQYDTASDGFRVLCLDECADVDLWSPLWSYYTEFQWDVTELSMQFTTEEGRNSDLVNIIGFYESEEKFDEYQQVLIYHGKTQFWVWMRNCTEYWIPLPYHSSYDESEDYFSATLTFHKDYASVLRNGELLLSFRYDSDIAMDLCRPTVENYYKNAFFYYGSEMNPSSTDKLRLVPRVANDTDLLKPEPDFKDFSKFDDQKFEKFSRDPLEFDFIGAPLQLKTVFDMPEKSNFSLALLNLDGEEIGDITIGVWEVAAFFMITPCHEGAILISIPKAQENTESTRIWTIETGENVIVLRCNGVELGRIVKGSNLVLDTCDDIFGEKVKSVEMRSAMPISYRILCLDNDDCGLCSAGTYSTDIGCEVCEENTFSGAGASLCTSCPDGMVSPVASTSKDTCYYAPCTAGNYMTDSGCKKCRENTYSSAGASSCTSCPGDRISPAGSTSEMYCYYAPCTAGNYMTDSGCQKCRDNTYSGAGASSCTSCPGNKISFAGSTAENDCFYAPCTAGSYMTGSGCQKCRDNSYSGAGASSCTSCPGDKISPAGSTSENDCYYAPCSAGNYMTTYGCRQCREDTYSGPGAFSCTDCPDRKISAAGSTSQDACQYIECLGLDPAWIQITTETTFPVEAGTVITVLCEEGYLLKGSNTITCTEGTTFSSATTPTCEEIVSCTAGNFMTDSGCQKCRDNTYSGAGASSCTSCPGDKISPAGSTSENDCYYASCSAGSYKTNNRCEECMENTYSGPGAFSCDECPDGMISAAGSTSKDACYSDKIEQKYSFKTISTRNLPRVGLLMATSLEKEEWKLVCRTGMGRSEVDALCRSMGYMTGTLIDVYIREFYDISAKTKYGVSDMKCPEGASSPSDCSYTPYSSASVPCIGGEVVSVSCSDEPFQLTATDFTARVHRRGHAFFKCSGSATRFGMTLDLSNSALAVALNRKNNGEISVLADKLYYRGSKRGYWSVRKYIKPLSWIDRCYICLLRMEGTDHMDIALSDDCELGKQQILSEIKDLMDRNVLKIGYTQTYKDTQFRRLETYYNIDK